MYNSLQCCSIEDTKLTRFSDNNEINMLGFVPSQNTKYDIFWIFFENRHYDIVIININLF